MQSVNEIVKDKKPSEIVEVMIQSLEKLDKDKRFRIDMDTYGFQKNKVCYGCAATATLIGLYPEKGEKFLNCQLDIDEREEFINDGLPDKERLAIVNEFENSIDELRCGSIKAFLRLWMGYSQALKIQNEYFDSEPDWHLETEDWDEKLPNIQKFKEWLISKGM